MFSGTNWSSQRTSKYQNKKSWKVRFNSLYHFKAESEVDKKGGPLLRGGINHASRARTRTPSSIYSWSIGQILEHEFFCLGHLGCAGSKGKKSGFEEFWATFEGGFFNILRANFFFLILKNILATALKSYIKWLLIFSFFLKKIEKFERTVLL